MDLTTELYLAAGLGALCLGVAAYYGGSGTARTRLFALLCTALALWNLGVFVNRIAGFPDDRWRILYLLGSCTAAPLGLHAVLQAVAWRGWRPITWARMVPWPTSCTTLGPTPWLRYSAARSPTGHWQRPSCPTTTVVMPCVTRFSAAAASRFARLTRPAAA